MCAFLSTTDIFSAILVWPSPSFAWMTQSLSVSSPRLYLSLSPVPSCVLMRLTLLRVKSCLCPLFLQEMSKPWWECPCFPGGFGLHQLCDLRWECWLVRHQLNLWWDGQNEHKKGAWMPSLGWASQVGNIPVYCHTLMLGMVCYLWFHGQRSTGISASGSYWCQNLGL